RKQWVDDDPDEGSERCHRQEDPERARQSRRRRVERRAHVLEEESERRREKERADGDGHRFTQSDRRAEWTREGRCKDRPEEERPVDDAELAAEPSARRRRGEVRGQERERRVSDVVEKRSDHRAVPIREWKKSSTPDHRREPSRDEERLCSPAIRSEADGQKCQRSRRAAASENNADVGGRRADLLQEQRQERREEPETHSPKDLRADEDSRFATETYARPRTMPVTRRASNSARALRSTSGSASTSIAVSASAFAAMSARSSASGVFA